MEAEDFMNIALQEAVQAGRADEVPIGAVIVRDGKVLAKAHNMKNKKKDATLHAEMLVLKKAQHKLKDWHLNDCDLYVTLEPCPMCAGACIQTRVNKIVFGAFDKKAGCCGTLYNLPEDARFNHRPLVVGGVLEAECGRILTQYFEDKRKRKANKES